MTRVTEVSGIFLQYHYETDTNLTMRGMETHQYTVNITSKYRFRAVVTLSGLQISSPERCPEQVI